MQQKSEQQYQAPFVRYVVVSVSVLLLGCTAFVMSYFNTDWFYEVDENRIQNARGNQARSINSTIVNWDNYVEIVENGYDEDYSGVYSEGSQIEAPPQYEITDEEIRADIAAGLYTGEDYAYLVALGGESSSYEGFYAVACVVRTRVEAKNLSYKEVVTQVDSNKRPQFSGYNPSEIGNPRNSDIRDAAVAVLRGGPSTVGNCYFFFGRINGNDMWADPEIAEFYNVGGNIFYQKWGELHNTGHAPEGSILIYNNSEGSWCYPSGTKYP